MAGEMLSFSFLAILLGFRHGIDSDHIAAITDMVGAKMDRRQQLGMGMMYSFGHGFIVLMLGMLAILMGSYLPEAFLDSMEFLVGITLIILGSYILYSIWRGKQEYQYRSRIEIAASGIGKLFSVKVPQTSKVGMVGAFCVGILHGFGAETPTQVAVLSSSVGFNNLFLSIAQLFLFVLGLLLSTTLVVMFASWGFKKTKVKQHAYLLLGSVTGLYSVILGVSMVHPF